MLSLVIHLAVTLAGGLHREPKGREEGMPERQQFIEIEHHGQADPGDSPVFIRLCQLHQPVIFVCIQIRHLDLAAHAGALLAAVAGYEAAAV